jgi:hypothetical protein
MSVLAQHSNFKLFTFSCPARAGQAIIKTFYIMFMRNIPQEKIDFVVAHMNDMPRIQISRAVGISIGSLYRIIRYYGGRTDGWDKPRSKELDKKVISLYADYSNPEIMKMTGASLHQLCRIRDKYGLKKSVETIYRIRKDLLNIAHSPETRAKAEKKWRALRKYDEYLINSGMKPKTHYRPRKWGVKAYSSAWAQCKNNNYFMLDEPYVLYYDSQTRRTRFEELITQRYGIKFKQADE